MECIYELDITVTKYVLFYPIRNAKNEQRSTAHVFLYA